jgi:predicted glutamine amidotransferase
MCRWIAYIGKPIYIDTLVTKPSRSLVEQSLHSKMSFTQEGSLLTTNGDGFGVGWYAGKEEPGLFKGAEPAWGNENLSEICSQVKAHIFMAHIRAASTGAVQRANAHPFKYKNWLFQHNGHIGRFEALRRDLQFDIAPELYPALKGTTDSETFFLLALTYGLKDDPKAALRKTISRVERACRERDVPCDVVLSCALSDGTSLYTLRYASGEKCHSQYYSTHADCMKDVCEDATAMPRNSVVVVSEPLDQSGEHWQEMPERSFAAIRDGRIEIEGLEGEQDVSQ